jgi:hypothetical protein
MPSMRRLTCGRIIWAAAPWLLASSLLVACSTQGRTGGGANDAGIPARLTLADLRADGRFTMHVDRVWNTATADVTLPSDPLSESDYQPVANGASYEIVLSGQGVTVAITGAQMMFHGARASATATRVEYTLDQGTFAGGRWAAWPEHAGLAAELTLFGSGRPVVKSERGTLARK